MISIGGCSGGAVQFAAVPNADDGALVAYAHPSGAFSLAIPRGWSIYEQNTGWLASAAFTPPESADPLILFAVTNHGSLIESAAFEGMFSQYLTQMRPDARSFHQTGRDQMPDGSWRISGYRSGQTGNTPITLFFQTVGSFVVMIEITPPLLTDSLLIASVEQVINSLAVNPNAALEVSFAASGIEALIYAHSRPLEVLHMRAWTAPDGALFVTGEVLNGTQNPISPVPVDVQILDSNGQILTGAADVVMGYGLPPGGYAPFSLRFGEGQPPNASLFDVRIGADQPPSGADFAGSNDLQWTDRLTIDRDNSLIISGEISLISDRVINTVRAVAAVFDAEGRVIAAGQTEISASLQPGTPLPYEVVLSALGDTPAQYTVFVQGAP